MERGGKISVEVLEEGQKDGHLEEERIEMGRKEGMGERQGERRGERQKKKKNRTPGRCKRNRGKLKLMRERAQREEFGNSRRQV